MAQTTVEMVRPAYLPVPRAAAWAGMTSLQLRRMIADGRLAIYRPNGSRAVALVRLRELREALERTRWPERPAAGVTG